jgi:hypothetical protein
MIKPGIALNLPASNRHPGTDAAAARNRRIRPARFRPFVHLRILRLFV